MRRLDWRYSTDFNQGTYTAAQLDTAINLSAYGHPAVEPLTPTFASPVLGSTIGAAPPTGYTLAQTLGYGANQWITLGTTLASNLAGDAFSLTTTANQVLLQLTGIFLAGLGGHAGDPAMVASPIRKGALANILIDGVLDSTVDCFNASPLVKLFLDGNSHVVSVVHGGTVGAAGSLIGPVTALSGTSVAAGLAVTTTSPSSMLDALYTITALSSTTYKVHVTPASGGGADVLTSVNINTPTVVHGQTSGAPAFSLTLSGILTPGDSATFSTAAAFLGLASVQLGSTGTNNPGTYTSQVIDSIDQQTQWFEADLFESAAAIGSFSLNLGNTPTPDGSWQAATFTPVDTVLPDSGAIMGVVSLSSLPRARYGQWSFTFGAAGAAPKWLRDVSLYTWVPERDQDLVGKLAVGAGAVMQPYMLNLLGLMRVHLADARQGALDLINSYAISTAADRYLALYGADLGLPRFSSEPPQAYQTRLTSVFRSLSTGGSIGFIARLVNELATGVNVAPVLNTTLLSATCGQTVVTQGLGQQLTVVVAPAGATAPNTGYAGFPNTDIAIVRGIITNFIAGTLVPVGGVINPANAGTYNIHFL